jgi:nicotinate dehydrogenase subunit A
MIEITVNGTRHAVEAAPGTPLLYVLRNELSLTGAKFGCGLGQCGACTVHLDGAAVRSCSIPVEHAAGKQVVTIEGLGAAGHAHPLQEAFVEEQAAQCGYCTTGMIMTAAALLKSAPQPSEIEIRRALHGNLCRCGTHLRVLRAIKRAAKAMAEAHS